MSLLSSLHDIGVLTCSPSKNKTETKSKGKIHSLYTKSEFPEETRNLVKQLQVKIICKTKLFRKSKLELMYINVIFKNKSLYQMTLKIKLS